MARRKTIAEYAKEYLEANGFDSVAHGDVYLLHEKILDALDRSRLFEKRYFRGAKNRPCRWFVLKSRALNRN